MRMVTADLRAALAATATAVSARPTAPILAAVRLTSSNDGSTVLAATDLDTWCSYRCGTDGTDELDVLVSHRTLASIAKVVRASVVELGVVGSKLTVTAGKSSWSAPLFEGQPPLSPKMPAKVGGIEAEVLHRLVRGTALAATRENVPLMETVQFRSLGDVLALSATDRYRAHIIEAPFKAGGGDVQAFPPAVELARIVDSFTGDVELFADEQSGVFGLSDGTTSVLLRTIAGEPPNMADYLTKLSTPESRTVVDASELSDALDAITPAAGGTGVSGVALFTVSAESFTVSAATDEADALATVDDFTHDGKGLTIAIRPSWVADALKAIGSARIELGWIAPTKPVVITADGESARCFLMPIRSEQAGWLDAPKFATASA